MDLVTTRYSADATKYTVHAIRPRSQVAVPTFAGALAAVGIALSFHAYTTGAVSWLGAVLILGALLWRYNWRNEVIEGETLGYNCFAPFLARHMVTGRVPQSASSK